VSDLLKAAADSPLLLTFLVVLGGGVWAAEKLGGVNGPISRAVRAWQNRELRRLERERLLADRRRELRDARIADLESEVAWLREQLGGRAIPLPARTVHPIPPPRHTRRDRLPATTPIPNARNSARAARPAR
jgi:hypothetical protein